MNCMGGSRGQGNGLCCLKWPASPESQTRLKQTLVLVMQERKRQKARRGLAIPQSIRENVLDIWSSGQGVGSAIYSFPTFCYQIA